MARPGIGGWIAFYRSSEGKKRKFHQSSIVRCLREAGATMELNINGVIMECEPWGMAGLTARDAWWGYMHYFNFPGVHVRLLYRCIEIEHFKSSSFVVSHRASTADDQRENR